MTQLDLTRSPVLIWDGDCAFCARCAAFLPRHRLGAGVDVVPWQDVDLAALAPDRVGLTAAACRQAVQWVDLDPVGQVRRRAGAAGLAAMLRHAGGAWAVAGAVAAVPPGSWLAAAVYRVVAANRHRLPGGEPACALPAATSA